MTKKKEVSQANLIWIVPQMMIGLLVLIGASAAVWNIQVDSWWDFVFEIGLIYVVAVAGLNLLEIGYGGLLDVLGK
jgi:hypothetical protein